MPAVLRVIAAMSACAITGVTSACGTDSRGPKLPAEPISPEVADRHDNAVERALSAMRGAARRGDRTAVGASQRELERLAQTDPAPATRSDARDPFTRVFEEFAFKRAPLYVQQISTSDGSHRVYVSVDRAAFCLMTLDARREAVRGSYGPTDKRLGAAGVTDMEFVVTGLTRTRATFDRALAVGRRGSVRLTQRGRACGR